MNYKELSYQAQKSAILDDLFKYVNHSHMVYLKSRMYQQNLDKLKEVERVRAFIQEIRNGKDLFTICLKIFRLKKRLIKILPHPNNNSYESQYYKINNIIGFATSYLQLKTQQYNPIQKAALV